MSKERITIMHKINHLEGECENIGRRDHADLSVHVQSARARSLNAEIRDLIEEFAQQCANEAVFNVGVAYGRE